MRPYFPTDACGKMPGDGNQMCQYVERYQYDEADNILSVQHASVSDPTASGWTRKYHYQEPSHINQNELSDRLSRSTVGNTNEMYQYDRQGCLIASSLYYNSLTWDFNNHLRSSSMQVVKAGIPETTWYVYDHHGRRVRKVTERCVSPGGSGNATKLKEVVYLPRYQMSRSFRGDGTSIKSEVTTCLVVKAPNDGLVALVEQKKAPFLATGPLVRYQASDMLELDDQGQVVSYEEYSPFGSST